MSAQEPVTSFDGEFKFLSNFFNVPVTYNGYTYVSSEQAYQAQKTDDAGFVDLIKSCSHSGKSKKLGMMAPLKPDWDLIKDGIMRDILIAKFTRSDMAGLLLATGERELIEGNHWGDEYWGVSLRTNQGLNKLGKLLMMIRDQLRTGQLQIQQV